jgi:hypothetical protein
VTEVVVGVHVEEVEKVPPVEELAKVTVTPPVVGLPKLSWDWTVRVDEQVPATIETGELV